MSTCDYNDHIGQPYSVLSREPRYAEGTARIWDDVADLALPSDLNVSQFLTKMVGNKTFVIALSKTIRAMDNGLPKDDNTKISTTLLNGKFAGWKLGALFNYVAKQAPVPHEVNPTFCELTRAVDGDLGYLLPSYQSRCSAPDCLKPEFTDGQQPTFMSGTRLRQWRHPELGSNQLSAPPMLRIQTHCSSKNRFEDGDQVWVDFFFDNPVHGFADWETRRISKCHKPSVDSLLAASQQADRIAAIITDIQAGRQDDRGTHRSSGSYFGPPLMLESTRVWGGISI
jgi:hypothetical protein